MKKYFLVVDAGTGSARGVVFDEVGNQISMAQQEWTHRSIDQYKGAIEFETKKNWEIICDLIHQSIEKADINASQIKAVSSTSMREGIVLYDSDNLEIWACSNIDARAFEEVIELKQRSESFEKEMYRTSGQTFSISAIPRLLWIKKNQPEVFNSISKLSMLSDWVLFKLSGTISAEPSNGSTSGLMDLKTRTWSEESIRQCGLPADIYPPVVSPGTVIGEVTEKASSETGLVKGTPVIMGGGDAQLGCVGLGAVDDRSTVILGGTFWQQEVNVGEPALHDEARIRVNCHAVDSMWQLEGISFLPGLVIRWLRDAFFQEEKKQADSLGIDPYTIIVEKAKEVPAGSHGIIPIFSDVMNYINWKHASPSFLNFNINDPRKSSKYVLFRSLMENACYIAHGNLQEIQTITNSSPECIIFAGGSSKSPFMCSMLADVTNTPVLVPRIKESTALGAALISAVGTGVYSSISEAVSQIVKYEAEFYPERDNHQLYMQYYFKWRKVYEELLKLTSQGLLKSMWASPGS